MSDDITLAVRSPNIATLFRQLMDLFWFSSTDEAANEGPRVVAVNRFGKEHTIQAFRSKRQALHALSALSEERDRIGDAAWCDAHGVPAHFELMQ